MTGQGFTPGPWEAGEGATTGCAVFASQPRTKRHRNVAAVGGPDREANARLIAAAPELYAALDRLLNGPCDLMLGGNPIVIDATVAQARAALAKAVQS